MPSRFGEKLQLHGSRVLVSCRRTAPQSCFWHRHPTVPRHGTQGPGRATCKAFRESRCAPSHLKPLLFPAPDPSRQDSQQHSLCAPLQTSPPARAQLSTKGILDRHAPPILDGLEHTGMHAELHPMPEWSRAHFSQPSSSVKLPIGQQENTIMILHALPLLAPPPPPRSAARTLLWCLPVTDCHVVLRAHMCPKGQPLHLLHGTSFGIKTNMCSSSPSTPGWHLL